MKHFIIDSDYTLRTDSDYSSTQILKWNNGEIEEVYSNNETFRVPDELEETDELPASVEINNLTHEGITMFYYKGILLFPECSKDIKLLLTLKWIKERFQAQLQIEDNSDAILEFRDAKFIFSISDKCTLLSAKGDYHKYMDYLYYRLKFTHQK